MKDAKTWNVQAFLLLFLTTPSRLTQVGVAPAAPRKPRSARTHRTETASCPMMKTPRRNTVGTGQHSPLSSSTNWRELSKSPITRTCTAGRSWRWRSTCRRSECRYECPQNIYLNKKQQLKKRQRIFPNWNPYRFKLSLFCVELNLGHQIRKWMKPINLKKQFATY